MTSTRVLADRRSGADRRADGRRRLIVAVIPERRRVVDRRCGAERRSTLDRRGRLARAPSSETPAEHVRNALQLLHALRSGGSGEERGADVAAAVRRLRLALEMLEHRG